MKKKAIYLVVIVIVLLICIIAFFKPLSLSDIARENNQIKMVLSELGVRNGEAYIDSVDYQDITTEQKSAILILLEKYTYKRTLGTLFSDGSISELGDKTLYIYVYDDVSLVGSIFVSSSGRIAVNEKNYRINFVCFAFCFAFLLASFAFCFASSFANSAFASASVVALAVGYGVTFAFACAISSLSCSGTSVAISANISLFPGSFCR